MRVASSLCPLCSGVDDPTEFILRSVRQTNASASLDTLIASGRFQIAAVVTVSKHAWCPSPPKFFNEANKSKKQPGNAPRAAPRILPRATASAAGAVEAAARVVFSPKRFAKGEQRWMLACWTCMNACTFFSPSAVAIRALWEP